jgi:hypothetical protein
MEKLTYFCEKLLIEMVKECWLQFTEKKISILLEEFSRKSYKCQKLMSRGLRNWCEELKIALGFSSTLCEFFTKMCSFKILREIFLFDMTGLNCQICYKIRKKILESKKWCKLMANSRDFPQRSLIKLINYFYDQTRPIEICFHNRIV